MSSPAQNDAFHFRLLSGALCFIVVFKAFRALEQPVDGRIAKSEDDELCQLRRCKLTGIDSRDIISFNDIFVYSIPKPLAIPREELS